ncbi:MAG: hypothetical protein ABJI96_23530 [Paracoccaceae bacterium]
MPENLNPSQVQELSLLIAERLVKAMPRTVAGGPNTMSLVAGPRTSWLASMADVIASSLGADGFDGTKATSGPIPRRNAFQPVASMIPAATHGSVASMLSARLGPDVASLVTERLGPDVASLVARRMHGPVASLMAPKAFDGVASMPPEQFPSVSGVGALADRVASMMSHRHIADSVASSVEDAFRKASAKADAMASMIPDLMGAASNARSGKHTEVASAISGSITRAIGADGNPKADKAVEDFQKSLAKLLEFSNDELSPTVEDKP